MRHIIVITSLALAVAACSGDAGDSGPTSPPDDASSTSDAAPPEGDSQAAGTDTGGPATDAEETLDTMSADAESPSDTATSEDALPEDVAGPQPDSEEPVEDVGGGQPDVDEPDDDAAVPATGPLLLCHILCDGVWDSCGSYDPYGVDQDSCVMACEAMTTTSLDGLVAMSCVADTCSEAMCEATGDESLVQPSCEEACGLLESCSLMTVVQPDYPAESDLCIVECSAAFIVDAGFMPALVGCIVDGLTEECDPGIMEECMPDDGPGSPSEGPSCVEICEIATTFKCPPWSDGPDAWPDQSMCLQDCEAFSVDPSSTAYTMYGCAMTTTCDNMEKCMTPPAQDDPGCEVLCAKAFEVCGDIGMSSPDFCTDYCTGQLMVFGSSVSSEDALACFDATPIDCMGDPYGEVLACLLDLETECTVICDALSVCPSEGGMPVEQCMPTCTSGYMNLFGALSTDETATCVALASLDCDAVEACLTPPAPPFCFGLCDGGMMCDPDLSSCMDQCDDSLETGGLASLACEFSNACADPAVCQGLDPSADSACVQACSTVSPTTCAAYPDGCVAACHGTVTGLATGDPALPMCVVELLGTDCHVESAYWSCQSL